MSNEFKQDDFLEAYNSYSDAIFRYCYYKTSDRERAKDLVQDTFTKAWEYIAAGNEVGNIKAFLYRIANNLIIDGFRKKKSYSLDVLEEQGFDPGVDKTDQLFNQIDGAIALKLLTKIPDTYREVITMRFVEELSIKEIAEILKEKENNISVKLHRGLEKLREIFYHETH
jgi:RNA polymerase sigma-70 factor, ECF subfamily